MPGNKTVYNEAIKKAANAAWDGDWKAAVAEYRRAVAEMPNDASAHASLAHALEQSKQLEQAVLQYREACRLSPNDPEPLARVASLQEKLGQTTAAAATYLAVAEMFKATDDSERSIAMWQRAAVLQPEGLDAHLHLAESYEEKGKRSLAAREFVFVSLLFQKRHDKEQMSSCALRALKLDPKNITARKLVDEYKLSEPKQEEQAPNPVDQAQKDALSRLAETLLEDKPAAEAPASVETAAPAETLEPAVVDALIARAVDAQTQGLPNEAIECYRQLLDAGVTRPEVKFNLGLLYFETKDHDRAIALLTKTSKDPNFALASNYTLGKIYRAKGRVDLAAEHYLEVTKIADLANVKRDQADELISIYEGLAESLVAKGDHEQAEAFSRALEEFLANKGWEDKVKQVRASLESLRDEGGQISLAEVIEIPNSDHVLKALALSQEHMKSGKFAAASDECLRAIELAPLYLSAHIRLARILADAGRIDEARAKYQTLADLSAVRSELARAEWFSRQLLEIAPFDDGCRTKLVDILIRQKREQAAVEQYLEFGNIYTGQGQYSLAAEKLAQGVQFAAKSGVDGPIVLNLYHSLAQAQSSLADFKGALATYKDIHHRFPDDDRAFVSLVDLEFRLGHSKAAEKDLEELLAQLHIRSDSQVKPVLEELIRNHPSSQVLRSNLAKFYIAKGDKTNAIAVLDALGEMQLSAGHKQDAAATIRQIMSLDPVRIDEYDQLLQSLIL